ncbi:sensor histidine kinase [Roseomonas sp. WA12]
MPEGLQTIQTRPVAPADSEAEAPAGTAQPAGSTAARWTFSQRLALVYGAVSLVILLGAGAFTAWQASLLTARNQELAVAETRRMADRVGASLAQARQGVAILATADPLSREPAECEALLNAAHLTMDAVVRHLFVVDAEGSITCTTLPPALGRRATSAVVRSAELTGRPITGALDQSTLGRVIIVAQPMRRGGRHIGVVTAVVGVEDLGSLTATHMPGIAELRVWLLDSGGAAARLDGPDQPPPVLSDSLRAALASPENQGVAAEDDQFLIEARATDDLRLLASIPGQVLQAGAPLEIALPPILLAFVLLGGMGALFWSVQCFVVAPLEAATRRLEAPDGTVQAGEGAGSGGADVADLIRRVGATRASRDEAIRLRDLLLREAHHRIKNHLTLVTSFLRLQERQLSDHAALQALRAAQGRMVAIGMTYELLHDGPGQFVALDQMLHRFSRALVARDMAEGNATCIETDLAPLEVPADIAVKIGLVVNELATNALKYAFIGLPPGTVRIVLRPADPSADPAAAAPNGAGAKADPPPRPTGQPAAPGTLPGTAPAPAQAGFTLRISDDGGGMAPSSRRGLGMTVVDSLLRGIDARIERLPGPGTTFLITWLPRHT